MGELRMCKRCKRELPIESFTKCKNTSDGIDNYCRECKAEIAHKYQMMLSKKKAKRKTKVCKACGKKKKMEEFPLNSTSCDGHFWKCTECVEKTRKAYKERCNAKARERYKEKMEPKRREKAERSLMEKLEKLEEIKSSAPVEKTEKKEEIPKTQVCRTCGIEKPLDGNNFSVASKSKTGFQTECRECEAKRRQERKEKKLQREELEKLLMIEREQVLRKCRSSFWAYNCTIAPQFYTAKKWHLIVLSFVLQYLFERKLSVPHIKSILNMPMVPQWFRDSFNFDGVPKDKVFTNLMINMPPRHGKSRTLVNFCDWILGKDPKNTHIITVSYNTDLATSLSRYVRDGIMMQKNMPTDIVYYDIFPGTQIAKGNSSVMKWAVNGSFFSYLGTGLEGTITGVGANCLVGRTRILTNKGSIRIEEICADKDAYLCYSLSHKSGKIVLRKILATREVEANEIVRIKTVSGREITCTKEHRFFDGRGYREAKSFRKGDYIYAVKKSVEQDLCNMRKTEGWKGTDVPGLLPKTSEVANKVKVCSMQENILQADAGLQQGTEKQHREETVLFSRMCKHGASKGKTLCRLREETGIWNDVLFAEMPRACGKQEWHETEAARQNLPYVWSNLQTEKPSDTVLFEGVCKQGTFNENEGFWKLELQECGQLHKEISGHEEDCFQAGQLYLCSLREAGEEKRNCVEGETGGENKPYMPSHRRRCDEQYNREHDNRMQDLSPAYSQIEADRIAEFETISGVSQPVYDLQIEGTGNFFGEGLNIHNCTIIDDPVKNATEAYSEKALDDIWNWYTGTFLSRQEDEGEGAINVINHTRWSTKDLCGRILSSERGKDWFVLSMPACFNGEMLCPSTLSKEKYEQLAADMDTNIFNANYLQKCMDVEGRLFDKLKVYDVLPEGTEGCIAYCDTADEGSDYLACVIGKIKDGEGYITDIYFTQENMTITEPKTAEILVKNGVTNAKIESNNGGRGFARNVEQIIWDKYRTRQVNITWFHQTENKMARILTGSTFIVNHVYFPTNWDKRWPEFYQAVMSFTKDGKNKHDDGVEALVEWGKMITGDGSINSYMEWMRKMQKGE